MRGPALCRPDLAAARDCGFARLASAASSGPVRLWGINGAAEADPYTAPEAWMQAALASLEPEADRLLDEDVFRPLCVEFGPYGVHFVDRMFGARVYEHAEQFWSEPLEQPVGRLEPPDLEADETWGLARRLAVAFLAARATVPLFGMPTIASALNVGVNILGDALLEAIVEDADAACHDLAIVNETLCAMHRWYRRHIPARQLQAVVAAQRCQPPGCGQLCGCTTQLVSARAYRESIAPLDEALLGIFPGGGMIHLCGAHTQHLPAWREMGSLRAVQLNDRAAQDLEAYARGLRPDQVIYLNPVEGMSEDDALRIMGGRRLVVVADTA